MKEKNSVEAITLPDGLVQTKIDGYYINRNGEAYSTKTGTWLKPATRPSGYKVYGFWNGSVCRTHFIHVLVAEAFIGKRPEKHVVNHKDGNKNNNNVENLEWVTSSENNLHAFRTGLRKPIIGTQHRCAKLDEQKVIEIRESKEPKKALAKKYGIDIKTLHQVLNRQTWKHVQ